MCGCNRKQGTYERPHLFGAVNGAEPIEVRLLMSFAGSKYGDTVWASGTGITNLVARNLIEIV